MKRWSRALPWLALAMLVGLGLAALWPGSEDLPPAPPPAASSAPEAAPAPAPPPKPAALSPPASGAPPPPDDPVAAYRERTRYAPGSGRLHEGAVDLLEPNRRYETARPIRDTLDRGADGQIRYLLDVDRYYYTGDEVATVALRVRRGAETVPVAIRRAVAVAEGASGAVGEEEPLRFVLRGGDPTADLDLEELFPEHHGPIRIVTAFEWEPGRLEEIGLRIFTTPVGGIPAEFTGRDIDYVENGSLVIDVGMDVFRAGFYRIDANLFGPDGAPLAFTSFKGELAAGVQRVPLEFFGLLLHDVGSPGPYELRNLRGYLFRDGEHPDRLRMREATHTHWTRAYELARFSDEEYTSEHKTRMLDLLEADVAAGIVIAPPNAAHP